MIVLKNIAKQGQADFCMKQLKTLTILKQEKVVEDAGAENLQQGIKEDVKEHDRHFYLKNGAN